jgi:hypothetical protein
MYQFIVQTLIIKSRDTSIILLPTLINKSPDPSPQFISEEDNETESENKILCTAKPKRPRKSNKRKSYEYY